MAIFTMYKFNNVNSDLAVLQNIADKCILHGWTVDRLNTTTKELYIHSNGNGNQNLYYSMGIQSQSGFYNLFIYGNTGYNGNNPFDGQPGRWTENYFGDYQTNRKYGNPFAIPLVTQYLLINQSCIFMALDSVLPEIFVQDDYYRKSYLSGRTIPLIFMGSIESYNSNETEGNMLLDFRNRWVFTNAIFNPIHLATTYPVYSYYNGHIYYYGEKKLFGSTVVISFINRTGYSARDYIRGFVYNQAVKMNSYTNKSLLIKPIISIEHAIGGYNYFFPIGELPYYAGAFYPYYTAGDIFTYGTRRFTALPLVKHTAQYGVFFEI